MEPVVVLPGLGNFVTFVDKLYNEIKSDLYREFIFSYNFNPATKENDMFLDVFVPFREMKKRFIAYLDHRNLLNKPINLIGFSQGGIIALYSAGMCKDIVINKYISIGSPHRGAYREENFEIIGSGKIWDDFEWDSKFMEDGSVYENAAKRVFKKVAKDQLLQIWSDGDRVARPESSKRFKKYMTLYEVKRGQKAHLALPRNRSVITKIKKFLKS